MERIPIVICIDVEPDEREIDTDSPGRWEGFEKTFEFFQRMRPAFEQATKAPVHYSWFVRMDPQIAHVYPAPEWALLHYREFFKLIDEAGDEIGVHTHAWRWDSSSKEWIADMADQSWVDHCVRVSLEAYRRSMHRPCRSFRFGDHWINNATLDLIESLGARFDLTVEPGHKRPDLADKAVGTVPDFTNAPYRPYQPSKSSLTTPNGNSRRLWLIPLSMMKIDWSVSSLIRKHAPHAAPNGKSAEVYASDLRQKRWDGFIDRADALMISGWAYDDSRPADSLNVEIYDGPGMLTRVVAETFRPDLLSAGKGNGKHSFSLPTPDSLKDGRPHSIWGKIQDTPFQLHISAVEQRVEPVLLLNTEPWLMKQEIDSLLNSTESPYLALPVRSNVSILRNEFENMQENLAYLLSHPLVTRFIFEPPHSVVSRFSAGTISR